MLHECCRFKLWMPLSKSLNFSIGPIPSTELLCEVMDLVKQVGCPIKKAQLYQRFGNILHMWHRYSGLSDRVVMVWCGFHFYHMFSLLVHSLGLYHHLSFYLCKHLYKCYPRSSAKCTLLWHLTCPRFSQSLISFLCYSTIFSRPALWGITMLYVQDMINIVSDFPRALALSPQL